MPLKSSEPIYVTGRRSRHWRSMLHYSGACGARHSPPTTPPGSATRSGLDQKTTCIESDYVWSTDCGPSSLLWRVFRHFEGKSLPHTFTLYRNGKCHQLGERCQPVFVDVRPDTFNIDPEHIEARITSRTRAILGVHVFSNPCEVEATRHELLAGTGFVVIYDARTRTVCGLSWSVPARMR